MIPAAECSRLSLWLYSFNIPICIPVRGKAQDAVGFPNHTAVTAEKRWWSASGLRPISLGHK